MNIKKFAALAAALLLTLSLAWSLAENAAGIDARLQYVDSLATYTPESYDTVWVTPVYADYIIAGQYPERNPSRFVCFPAPQGATLGEYRYDSSLLIDDEARVSYLYAAYERISYEVFLEKAEEENIIKDGSDGVAIYIKPDDRRGDALINLKPHFEGTPKLLVTVRSYDRNITGEQLKELITAEAERVQAEMSIVDTERFWSAGVYNAIEIMAYRHPEYAATVRVADKAVTSFAPQMVITKETEGNNARATEIKFDSYSQPHVKEAEGDPEVKDAVMADGTAYKYYQTDYTGYASFTMLENGSYDSIYLTVKIDGSREGFAEALEELYARITLTSKE